VHHPALSHQNPVSETLELVTPNTPAFDEAVRAIGMQDSQSLLAPILPYSVFVRNVSANPLILVTVRYLFQNNSGKEISGTHSLQLQPQPGGHQMLPEDIAFLPPIGGLARLTKGSPRDIPAPQHFENHRDTVIARFAASPYLRIATDSAVFSDGTIVGPDHAARMETENASRQAEQEILDEIRSLTQPAALVHLAAVSEQPITEHLARTAACEYAYRRKHFAEQLRSELAAGARPYPDVLSSWTENLRHTPIIHRRP
jgi:hypothetical protein